MIRTRQRQKDNIVRKTDSLMEYDNDWAVKLRLHEGAIGWYE